MSVKLKWVLSIAAVIVVVLGGGAAYFYYQMNQPLYQVGMVRAETNLSSPLSPPEQGSDSDAFWDVGDGIRIHHFAQGVGNNILVVHGGPGLPFSEPPEGLSLLAGKFRFVYYDQRGSGRSTRPFDRFPADSFYKNLLALDRKLGLGAQIADIERIRRILKEDKLTIVAHSFGAFIAALYAAEFPDRVNGLILIAPASVLVMPNPEGDLFSTIENLIPAEMKADFNAYKAKLFDVASLFSRSEDELVALNDEFVKFYIAALKAKGLALPQLSAGARSGGWMMMGTYMSMGLKADYRNALKSVGAPALVIHAANDFQSEVSSRMYADALPNAEFRVIENSGHFPLVEQPEAFAKLAEEFLEKVVRLPSP